MSAQNLTATIFDIQGFSVHDGPGCRTVVFMKGCPLRCEWCCNPEGFEKNISILYNTDKCILDGNCIAACPFGAITLKDEKLEINRQHCINCKDKSCISACNTGALNPAGKTYTIDELFARIQRDRTYWGAGGGVTLSGGEPFLQHEFATAFLKKCYESYIHTAIETCGNLPWRNYEQALDYIDWVFFDLKHLNSDIHKQATHAGNEMILANAVNFAKFSKARIIFRLALIPGFNDTNENLMQTAEFIKAAGKSEINILPLHHLGRGKYDLLDMSYKGIKNNIPSNNDMKDARQKLESFGLTCYLGSDTPF